MKLAEYVAAYGAILSTVVAYRQWRTSQPNVRITSMPAYNGRGYEPEGQFVRVVLANEGASDIHLRQAHILLLMDWATWRGRARSLVTHWGRWRAAEQLSMGLPDGTIVSPPLPAALKPGQAVVVWLPQAKYAELRTGPRVRGMQVAVQDETDRTFVSHPLPSFGAVALPNSDLPRG